LKALLWLLRRKILFTKNDIYLGFLIALGVIDWSRVHRPVLWLSDESSLLLTDVQTTHPDNNLEYELLFKERAFIAPEKTYNKILIIITPRKQGGLCVLRRMRYLCRNIRRNRSGI
jgi:hypothetical protein